MIFKQALVRILGVACFSGGLFAFYDYGREILPIFERFVAGAHDSFEIFTILSSFFLGGVALTWVGTRLVLLRSFSGTWLYYAVLPIVAWQEELYDVGLIFKMDRVLSQSVVYLSVYVLTTSIALFVHKHWFTPLSHESMRYVGTEEGSRSGYGIVRWVLVLAILIGLLVLHPRDLGTTLRMLVSPIGYVVNLVR